MIYYTLQPFACVILTTSEPFLNMPDSKKNIQNLEKNQESIWIKSYAWYRLYITQFSRSVPFQMSMNSLMSVKYPLILCVCIITSLCI